LTTKTSNLGIRLARLENRLPTVPFVSEKQYRVERAFLFIGMVINNQKPLYHRNSKGLGFNFSPSTDIQYFQDGRLPLKVRISFTLVSRRGGSDGVIWLAGRPYNYAN